MTRDREARGSLTRKLGRYIQIYPSALVNASRMYKIGTSLHSAIGFDETHLVGVRASGLPASVPLADGIYIKRIDGSGRRGNVGRVLRAVLWQPRVFLTYRRQSLEAVAVHNVWILPLGRLLARATGAPLIYNAHELETEAIAMQGLKKRVAKLIESWSIHHCALVSVVNESIAEWYETEYSIRRPTVVGNVPVSRDADVSLRKRLGIDASEMLYIHTGNLVEGRNIPLILKTFGESPHHVVFLGDGHLREAVVAAQEEHHNIHWLPPVDPELIVAHVREADVGLCLIEDKLDLSDKYSSPNKLLEALAAGVPPLCTDLIEARRLLGEFAGDWIVPSPETELAAAVRAIDRLKVTGFKARWGGTTSWSEEVDSLIDAYLRVLD